MELQDLSRISSVEELEQALSEPNPGDIDFARELEGDVLILGAAGKMGPTLARRIKASIDRAEGKQRVFAVSRFSNEAERQKLEAEGVIALRANLLDRTALEGLPDCPNVLFMVGAKFGTSGNEPLTWATNTYLPGVVAARFPDSRVVSFSTGNVYPLVPVHSGGSSEQDPVGPIGEYAQSALGRERVLEYFSRQNGTPLCILRLNYAVEARYGVILDISRRVFEGEAVPLEMGYFNAIWQGDANSVALRAFSTCKCPPEILNVTGPETISVRQMASEIARKLGRKVVFRGNESETALLSNATKCHRLFGKPHVSAEQIADLVTHWLKIGGPTLDKPTKFEVRNGRF